MNKSGFWVAMLCLSASIFASAIVAQQPAASITVNQPAASDINIRGRKSAGLGFKFGTVTAVFSDHFTITDGNNTYTVRFNADTRFMLPPLSQMNCVDSASARSATRPPSMQSIQASQISVGDDIDVSGKVDDVARLVASEEIVRHEPGTTLHSGAIADYGKTWVMGKVTSIDGGKITIKDTGNGTVHDAFTDTNTVFSQGRNLGTLADVQIGDELRIDGSVRDGVFVAIKVSGFPKPKPCPTPSAQSH